MKLKFTTYGPSAPGLRDVTRTAHHLDITDWFPCDVYHPPENGVYMLRKRGMFPTSPFPMYHRYGRWFSGPLAVAPSDAIMSQRALYEFCGLASEFQHMQLAPRSAEPVAPGPSLFTDVDLLSTGAAE